jgi:hypothetical protein
MPACVICGEPIPEGSRTCSMCGSSADEFFPMGTELKVDDKPKPAVSPPSSLPPGGRHCPTCASVFGPEYTDAYCTCGTELVKPPPEVTPIDDEVPMAPILDDLPMAPVFDDDGPTLEMPTTPIVEPGEHTELKNRAEKPSPGTPCLVLYGTDKQPLRYFTLEKDAVLIGRLDAVAGNFPDIDLDEWFDRATIRKISRQHALILRTRATNTFVLRPLTGNTGTQLETQMLPAMQDYPLRPGHRIILGGVIRMKFEIA